MTEEQQNPFEQGPYVQVAAFCEKVLRERDGVMSLIRIVDVINHSERGDNPPADMPPFRYPLTLVLVLKSGRARGRHEVTIIPELPSGESLPQTSMSIQLEGEGRGTAIDARVDVEWTMEGLYWFNIKFGDQLLTRLPMHVRYSRLAAGSSAQAR